ncbi:LysR family transcriptional regulator [Maritimibacter dapengensis]|uniref:LysR family transcriptional regulator n=1 Tax=Maritimibacter dapengensis TaxID=2836868 RepID=A0ABS6T0K2_9RHOB|nr:LysR family transcriptional regulator [Maritimibacter dapengensis]MBV7378510.1 LysR family transcriptional regulator [Maritimibacter dapengensis]
MRFKKLDLNLLVALDHMLEHRSVTQAAEHMFMSQSAMSNALTRLRTYFDDPLLVQVGRRMELTPRAEALRPAIRDVLVRVEAAIDRGPQFHPDRSDRTFNLLLSDYALNVLMPEVLRRAEAHDATVKFNLRAQTAAPYTLIERGEVDLLVAPEQFTSSEHPSALVYEDQYKVVAWKHGAYGKGTLDRERYEKAGHVVMVPPQKAQTVEGVSLAEHGVDRRIEVTTFAFTSLTSLISGTNRIATVHGRLAAMIPDADELVVHPFPFDAPPLRQIIQWHVLRDTDPGLIWLRDLVLEAAAALPAVD